MNEVENNKDSSIKDFFIDNSFEKIIKCDHDLLELEYSAIETLAPINHHLAKINLISHDNKSTDFIWTTEIDPEEFADAIHQGMVSSLDQLELVLSETD